MAKIVCESKAIIPNKFNVDPIINSIPLSLRAAAADMLKDFESTAANWDHKPTFTVTAQGKDRVSITTTDENWIRIDQGVKRTNKVITARRGPSGKRAFRIVKRRAKSRPGVLRSSGGGPTGEVVYRASYKHRGITPRNFTQTIADKYTKLYPRLAVATTEQGVQIGVSGSSKDVKVKAGTVIGPLDT